MACTVKNNITWVGKVDWELRKFHGNEYSTHRGSTYNSYLVREEKTALIDTVWAPFAKDFVANLEKIIDLHSIDYVIANHGEIDHSGALPELMRRIPDKPIYCTANGVKSLKGHYHRDWNFVTVRTGDRLSLGSKELVFIEAPMLHWPDTMMCYLTGDNVLFSNDAFGQHYATSGMFNDTADRDELYAECMKYYANILTPFSPLVTKKINEVLSFKLPVDMICTSHGVIWRDNPAQIVEKYLVWADAYRENQVTILYDTMWGGTRVMAEAIAAGIREVDGRVAVKLFNASTTDKNDLITEVFRAKAVGVGSPTINQGILCSVAALLEEMRGLKFRKKKAFAFGSYGWSGESVKMIAEGLKLGGFDLVGDGIRALWNPDDDAVKACIDYGRKIAESLN
ncbi:MAG TPA: anaerobic nitric oxide reductase flavorubredoxin [Spirochaetota bacterium]|mgnify:CR=1 FL=1|nr:anaerobic nitric oxide reductase flavorubredoxin [Spirochaetota bacterium]HPC39985.1 anaerobic nitric oxide reductase flavorubredoxin [Spirochaetota bacterium]HQF09802.1 anaerobic nitric oxide reductase flavorubredoxin [Spirochaetota bacterium]HQH98730.1 anaerobic nitric oxide reductase flavorubredoxin [Spirochaetota bacterium]HQJ72152.1 anaerobic nitric oxide reductase flavorubredoxin [Spirochaetota bacterium]